MIAALASARPWVWLGSGDFFRVQFTNMAFSPLPSKSARAVAVAAAVEMAESVMTSWWR
jgi:hypothetical protein